MSRIVVAGVEEASAGSPPDGARLSGGAAIPVIADATQPLQFHALRLDPGGQFQIDDARGGSAIYVRSGAVEVAGHSVGAGGAIVIEHRATATIAAEAASDLLCFSGVGESPSRAGGHLHILPPSSVPRCADLNGHGVGGALFADAACPSCEMWLHETTLAPAGEVPLHAHSEDEIIVVLEGELLFGPRVLGTLGALAIPRQAHYSFRAGPGGLVFINFRPRSPTYLPRAADREPIDERAYYLAHMPPPAPLTIASPRN
jgi:hypothetical protein